MSKSQLKKQAQLQARVDAQNKKKGETAEKTKEQLEEQQSQSIKSKKLQAEVSASMLCLFSTKISRENSSQGFESFIHWFKSFRKLRNRK